MDGYEEVGVVVGGHALQHRGQALEAHARIDGLEGQLRTRPLERLVELHEHEVPDLQPARAGLGVVGHAARAFRVLDAAVEVDLAVGSAWAGVSHAPEVVVVAVVDVTPAGHAFGRQADLVAPDGPRLLVVGVGRGGQAIRGDAQVLGQELPGPVDGLALEVVAEGPAAEHLEERVVARGASDLLEVVVLAGYAQAPLRVHGAGVGARLDSSEDVLELDHAAVGEEQRLVARRHEAGAGHDLVAALLEEAQEAGADLIRGQGPHRGAGRVPVLGVRHLRECSERMASRSPRERQARTRGHVNASEGIG